MMFEKKVKAIYVKPIFLAWGCVQNQTVETVLGLDAFGETKELVRNWRNWKDTVIWTPTELGTEKAQ